MDRWTKSARDKLYVLAWPSMGPVDPMFWCPQHGPAYGPVGSPAGPAQTRKSIFDVLLHSEVVARTLHEDAGAPRRAPFASLALCIMANHAAPGKWSVHGGLPPEKWSGHGGLRRLAGAMGGAQGGPEGGTFFFFFFFHPALR